MTGTTAPELVPSRDHLRWLFWLRNVAIATEVLVLGVAAVLLHLPLPWGPLAVTVAAWAGFNAYVGHRVRYGPELATLAELRVQLVVDLAQITIMLTMTGGAANPFVSIYLIPIAVSAAILPQRDTWLVAAAAIGAYTMLLATFQPEHLTHGNDTAARNFHWHVIGMWVHFILAAVLVAGFVAGLAATIRRQQRLLSEASERALRDAQLVSLGALAAGTAHELGTPLGTMALVADELAQGAHSPEQREAVEVLRRQIGRCREALATLSAASGGVRMDGGAPVRADRFVRELVAHWRQAAPETSVQIRVPERGDVPTLLAERTLSQAIANLLDNAARASPEAVEIVLDWNATHVILEILDRGPGLAGFRTGPPGQRPAPGQGDGLGLGLFLSRAIIERLRGRLHLYERPGGGLVTRVELPRVHSNA